MAGTIHESDLQHWKFSSLPRSVCLQLAMFLDLDGDANWEKLAEKLNCAPLAAEWMKTRARNTPMGSPTLVFFNEFCTPRNISLVTLILALEQIENLACIDVLQKYLNGIGASTLATDVPAVNVGVGFHRVPGNGAACTQLNDATTMKYPVQAALMDNTPTVALHMSNMSDAYAGSGNSLQAFTPPVSHSHLGAYGARMSLRDDERQHWLQVSQSSAAGGWSTGASQSSLGHSLQPQYNRAGMKLVEEPAQPGEFEHILDLRCTERAVQDGVGRQAATVPAATVKAEHAIQKCDMADSMETEMAMRMITQLPVTVEKKEFVSSWIEQQEKFTMGQQQVNTRQPFLHEASTDVKRTVTSRRISDPPSSQDLEALSGSNTGDGSGTSLSMRNTASDLQRSVFSVDTRHVRVFVTYATDSKQHERRISKLCDCLKKNHFSAGLDIREIPLLDDDAAKAQWYDMRYTQANYVLIVVSPLYRRIVDGDAAQQPVAALSSSVQSNAVDSSTKTKVMYIHQRMMEEYKRSPASAWRRFIPIIMPGATPNDIPLWLQRDRKFTAYNWPDQYSNLFYYMMQPEQIITEFVSRCRSEPQPNIAALPCSVNGSRPLRVPCRQFSASAASTSR